MKTIKIDVDFISCFNLKRTVRGRRGVSGVCVPETATVGTTCARAVATATPRSVAATTVRAHQSTWNLATTILVS